MGTASVSASLHKVIGYALADGFNPCELLAYQSFLQFVKKDGRLDSDHIRLVLTSYEEPICYVEFPNSEDPDSGSNEVHLSEYSINDDEEMNDVYQDFYDKLMVHYLDLVK